MEGYCVTERDDGLTFGTTLTPFCVVCSLGHGINRDQLYCTLVLASGLSGVWVVSCVADGEAGKAGGLGG